MMGMQFGGGAPNPGITPEDLTKDLAKKSFAPNFAGAASNTLMPRGGSPWTGMQDSYMNS
jgi:hypothetical protein